MARLKIGSYIIDSADSASTSTTSGVVLDLDGAEPLAPSIEGGEYIWPIMYAYVTAASESALKTAVDTVVDKINQCPGQAIVYEETSGTTLFEMHPNIWPDAQAQTSPDYSGLSADIAFQIRGVRPAPLSGSGGTADEAGQRGTINWQYEITPGGIAGMVATATFGPTLSGTTVTAGARENAVAWINKLRNTANYPAWLDTNFRMVHAAIDFDQKQNQGTVGESSYDPCVAVLSFREVDSALTLPTNVLSADWAVVMDEREPVDVRSGQVSPGFQFELTGTVTIKTEGNTTFNSSETNIADANVYTTAETAVSAIITHFQAVYAGFALTQIGSPRIGIDAIQGNASFGVTFTSQTAIRSWEEEGELTNQWSKIWSRATDGTDWRFANEGGPIKMLTHRLRIVSMDAPQPYRAPTFGDDNWDEVEVSRKPVKSTIHANGLRMYVTEGEGIWRYVNKSPRTVNPDEKYASSPKQINWDALGSGDIGN